MILLFPLFTALSLARRSNSMQIRRQGFKRWDWNEARAIGPGRWLESVAMAKKLQMTLSRILKRTRPKPLITSGINLLCKAAFRQAVGITTEVSQPTHTSNAGRSVEGIWLSHLVLAPLRREVYRCRSKHPFPHEAAAVEVIPATTQEAWRWTAVGNMSSNKASGVQDHLLVLPVQTPARLYTPCARTPEQYRKFRPIRHLASLIFKSPPNPRIQPPFPLERFRDWRHQVLCTERWGSNNGYDAQKRRTMVSGGQSRLANQNVANSGLTDL